jgi:DnaJ-class molecular chaperone
MNKAKLLMACTVLTVGFLSSCSIQEIFSDTVELETYKGLQKAQKSKGSHPSEKQQAKETELLKQEGKCPSCRGAGKTPDGRYTCTVCNGTGQYQEKKE